MGGSGRDSGWDRRDAVQDALPMLAPFVKFAAIWARLSMPPRQRRLLPCTLDVSGPSPKLTKVWRETAPDDRA